MSAETGASLRLVYMGTADFAVPALQALARSRHEVVAVYTQPARPAGRGMKARPSPIERTASDLGLPVLTPVGLKGEAPMAELAALAPDLAVVAAYGLLLPQAILDVPRLGCINLHGSRLPRWRGAAPIQRAILAGDPSTGVTIIQMEAGLDTGPMLAMEEVAIGDDATAEALHDALADLAAEMAAAMVDRLADGPVDAAAQPEEGATYAHKIEKSEGRIDWRRTAAQIDRQVRALNPWPGCWTEFEEQRLRVLAGRPHHDREKSEAPAGLVLDDDLTVACGEGAFRITRLQRSGGKPMTASDFLRGFPVSAGARLGLPCPATS